jgi:tetratricopeptide (TPR) repeat protein
MFLVNMSRNSENDKALESSVQVFEDLPPGSFQERIHRSILISPKNAILYSKTASCKPSEDPNPENEFSSFESCSISSSSSTDNFIQYETGIIIDPFFILSSNFLSKLVDFPPKVPKNLGRITSESLFEQGKSQLYLNLDLEALKSFEKSLFIEPNDMSFIWKVQVQVRNSKLLQDYESSWCGRRKGPKVKGSYKYLLEKLLSLEESIEKNWVLMEMSCNRLLKVGKFIEPWQFYASKILNIDKYYGFLAWAVQYSKSHDPRSVALLQRLTETFVSYPHAYILLWQHHYSRKEYLKSYNIIAECFVKANDIRFHNFSNLIFILYSKSLFKLKRFTTALEMMQRKYEESENNLLFLYKFGKICIKAKTKKFIITGLSALKEVLRWVRNFAKVNFWFAVACYKTGRLAKAEKHFQRVLYSLDVKEVKIANQVQEKIRKIAVKKAEIQSYKEKILKEKFPKLHDIEQSHYVEIIKTMQADEVLKSGNPEKALEILREVPSFEAFCLIFHKILPGLPVKKGHKLLLEKLEQLKRNSVPVYEFINSCVLFAEFLKNQQNYEEAFSVLKSVLNFFPNFKADVPYLKNSNISSISVKLIGLKNLFETSCNKKKDLILKAVRGKSQDFLKVNSKKHKRIASLNVGSSFQDNQKSSEKVRTKSIQNSISGFGVYTSPKILLKCAEVLMNIPGSNEEVSEILKDFLEICEKPFFKNLASKMLESLKFG